MTNNFNPKMTMPLFYNKRLSNNSILDERKGNCYNMTLCGTCKKGML